jgi:hypothetical protein
MAAKNVGITLFSIAVAIAAFIVSNIWAQELHEKVESARHATEGWKATYASVSRKEIDIGSSTPTDRIATEQRLQQRLQLIHETDEAETPLWQTKAVKPELFAKTRAVTEQQYQLQIRSGKIDSLDNAAALDKEAERLFQYSTGLGVLMNLDVLHLQEQLESRESYVKWVGYTLGILALIVAGIAQLAGKG